MVLLVAGGLLAQDRDNGYITRDDLEVVTRRAPGEAELDDLLAGNAERDPRRAHHLEALASEQPAAELLKSSTSILLAAPKPFRPRRDLLDPPTRTHLKYFAQLTIF